MTAWWSAHVIDSDGSVLFSEDAERLQSTASLGKLFSLAATAEAITSGEVDPTESLTRPADAVSDSGLWQHLTVAALAITDAAVLTAAVSDNLAANALLDRWGHSRIDDAATRLGCEHSRLIDRIRDVRAAEDPPAPSVGRADELAGAAHLVEASARGASHALDTSTARLLRTWLLSGVDLSMVAAPFALDPLAHAEPDRGITLWNKTGTDTNVRCDMGVIATPDRWIAYAALAEWPSSSDDREDALGRMHALGEHLHDVLD